MSVKINGAIFRNVPGESEGIDTPSLLINGQPISGGSGTQLYKHTVAVAVNYDNSNYNTTCIFITASNTSFTGKNIEVLANGYISGVIDMEPIYDLGVEHAYRIIIGIQGGSETTMSIMDELGESLSPAIYFQSFGTDTVEAI